MSKQLNKVLSSPYKDEIEKRLALGSSPRSISNWLRTRGEEISHTTIVNYKKEYFNIDKEVSKIMQEKQKETEEAIKEDNSLEEVQKTLNTQINMHVGKVRAVNHISVLYDNIHDMREYLNKLQHYEPVVAAHAAKGLYQEIRATIETLEKIKNNGEDNTSSVAKLLSELSKQKKELDRIAGEE